MTIKRLIGSAPSQVSRNKDLGSMAFQNKEAISVDSLLLNGGTSSDALRITQTGTGNALVVEDSPSPDSTPFVIDAVGRVINGHTGNITGVGALQSSDQLHGTTLSTASRSQFIWSNDSSSTQISFNKSRGTSPNSQVSVVNGDAIGQFIYGASDGTGFIRAASIAAQVDATPATGSMPGRLVFSTTPSGSGTPVERMRIDSAGRITTGGITTALTSFALGGIHPSSGTGARSLHAIQTIPSGVTSYYVGFHSEPVTQAASFTLTELSHFKAQPQTFGAGSSVTSQYGFNAASSLTGATNNYGFYSNIAEGTGRWNFYANGTADNYFAGNVGIGTTPANRLDVTGNYRLTGFQAINATPSTTAALRIGQGADQTLGTDYSILFTGVGYTGGIALNATSMQIGQNSAGRSLTFHSGTGFAERLRIDSSGNVLVTNPAGLGYGTGAGGTVTQATSKATVVTLNKPTGRIVMSNSALAGWASVIFAVNNTFASQTDVVIVNVGGNGFSGNYLAQTVYCVDGTFGVRVINNTGGSLSEAVIINFAIIKGATA